MRDLDELAAYIADQSEQSAAFVESRIHQEAQLLSRFPYAGRRGRVAGIRERIVVRTPFLLAYQVKQNTVRIVRVLRGARRWPARFE
jgi:toxin ParE1/3/4